MKKLITSIFVLLFSSQVFAQCDTLENYDGLGIVANISVTANPTPSNWGYVNGHNSNGHLAKLEAFDYTGALPAQVTSLLLQFPICKTNDLSHTVEVAVWDDNAGKPGAIIGSTTIPLQTITDAIPNLLFVEAIFATPVNLTSGKFYAGMKCVYNVGDTLGIGVYPFGSVPVNTAWEQWSNSTFHPLSLSNAQGGWGMKTRFSVFPMICSVVDIDAPLLADIRVYPNPSNGDFSLQMNHLVADEVVLTLYDLQGKPVYNESISTINGTVKKDFSFNNLAKGSYILRFFADGKYANYKLLME